MCTTVLTHSLTNNQECIVCSSEIDSNCIDLHQKPMTSVCINSNNDQQKNACFTHVNRNGTVTRGCLFDEQKFENECKNGKDDDCTICQRDNCNNRPIETTTCYTCSSENDPNCRENLNNSMRTTCALSVENFGCYRFDDGGMYGKIIHFKFRQISKKN